MITKGFTNFSEMEKMILTLTANPSIDRTLMVENFTAGKLNRVIRSRVDVGGKGINVARNLKSIGDDVVTTGFIGNNALWIADFLQNEGIIADFVKIEKDTRTNIKVFDISKKELTELNEQGPEATSNEVKDLKEKVLNYAEMSEVIVLTGSLPPQVPKTFYRDLISEIKRMNTKIILDAEGEALIYGISEKPFMIKPNLYEFENLIGKKIANLNQLIEEGKKLNDNGIDVVAISMGSNGSIVITDMDIFIVEPIKVDFKSTVGAGDAYVAGFAHGLYRKLSIEETIRIAVAMSTAVVMKEGTSIATFDEISRLKDKVKFRRIER